MNTGHLEKKIKPPLWQHPAAVLIFFAVIGFALYSQTLDYNLHFDSIGGILNKERIHLTKLSFHGLLKAVKSGRPVGDFTLALNWYVHQEHTAGYRIVNICIHVLTALFFYLFALRTVKLAPGEIDDHQAFFLSFAAAAIWLAHPVNTQSVTYVIQRYNSLAAMFFILSMLCYAKGRMSDRRVPWLAASAIAGLLSLGSKQNTAVLPFFLFLYEWYFFQHLNKDWLKRNIKYPIALIAAVVVIGLIYLGGDPVAKLTKFRDYAEGQFTLTERFLTQFRVIVYYISLFFFPLPSRLSLDYDFPLSHSLFDPITTLLSLLGLLGLLAVAVFQARRRPLLSFGILWFFGTLAVESSVIPLAVIFEHRTYLPYTFASLLAVLGLSRLVRSTKLQLIVVAAVFLTFGVWTFQRNDVWENGLTLWTDVLKKAPGKPRALSNLGTAIEKREGIEAAATYYEKAVENDPDSYEALNNLGRARYRQGRYQEAMALFDRALAANPRLVKAMNNKGSTYLAMGQPEKAIEQFNAALPIEPNNPETEKNLGSALLGIGQTEAAVAHLRRAVLLDPEDAEARINLAAAQMQQGDLQSARIQLEEALKIDPDHPNAHNNLATLLIQDGDIEQAEVHFREALRIDPGFDPARENLERLISMTRDPSAKADRLRKAIAADPKNPVPYWELGRLFAAAGRMQQAVAMFESAVKIDGAFLPALNDTAAIYAHQGKEALALEELKKIIDIDPNRADALYNAACMAARLNQPKDALAWLKKAMDAGYRQWDQIASDPDLNNIRHLPAFQELLQKRR